MTNNTTASEAIFGFIVIPFGSAPTPLRAEAVGEGNPNS